MDIQAHLRQVLKVIEFVGKLLPKDPYYHLIGFLVGVVLMNSFLVSSNDIFYFKA